MSPVSSPVTTRIVPPTHSDWAAATSRACSDGWQYAHQLFTSARLAVVSCESPLLSASSGWTRAPVAFHWVVARGEPAGAREDRA